MTTFASFFVVSLCVTHTILLYLARRSVYISILRFVSSDNSRFTECKNAEKLSKHTSRIFTNL